MRRLTPFFLMILGLGLGFVLFNDGAGQSNETASMSVAGSLGSDFTYQGYLALDGAPADGSYDLRFRLFDAANGGAQVSNTVSMPDQAVTEGLFTVQLDFGTEAFDGSARWLEIAVREGNSQDGYTTLSPRQPLTATPYALHARQASSLDAAHVLVVAKEGGDFNSVQMALDSINDASASNPYVVYVAPGIYDEQVTLKPHVALEGAGEGKTILRWSGGNEVPDNGGASATLRGADNVTVRHLTVESDGTGQDVAVALYSDGHSATFNHITASASGGATYNVAIYYGGASSPSLSQATAISAGGFFSYGVYNSSAGAVTMDDVVVSSSTGNFTRAVVNGSTSAVMNNMTITAVDGTNNEGVRNTGNSAPVIRNVMVTATGGVNNVAVNNYDASPTVQDSVLEGDTTVALGGSGNVRVANSQLIGPVGSGITCFNNYDLNMNAVSC